MSRLRRLFQNHSNAVAQAFVFATALNLGLCVGLAVIRNAEPVKNLYLVPHAEAIWLVGETVFGFRAVRGFKTWTECEEHFAAHGWQLLDIDYVQRPQSDAVSWARVGDADRPYYKVSWTGPAGKGVVHAPDSLTAERIVNYLRYQTLRSGPLGFGLPLARAR